MTSKRNSSWNEVTILFTMDYKLRRQQREVLQDAHLHFLEMLHRFKSDDFESLSKGRIFAIDSFVNPSSDLDAQLKSLDVGVLDCAKSTALIEILRRNDRYEGAHHLLLTALLNLSLAAQHKDERDVVWCALIETERSLGNCSLVLNDLQAAIVKKQPINSGPSHKEIGEKGGRARGRGLRLIDTAIEFLMYKHQPETGWHDISMVAKTLSEPLMELLKRDELLSTIGKKQDIEAVIIARLEKEPSIRDSYRRLKR